MGSLSISLTSPEHLEFNIRIHLFNPFSFYENLRNALSHLDTLASSHLQRVDINFDYVFRHDHDWVKPDGNKILEAVLDGLPLLRTKGILSVDTDLVK